MHVFFFQGLTQQEVQKLIPKAEERRRYTKRVIQEEPSHQNNKKAKLDSSSNSDLNEQLQKLATETNEKYVLERLNIDTAVQLVLSTSPKLPAVIPNQFKIDYTAFMKMGHVGELKVLAKMLAIQLLEAGIGPGADVLKDPPNQKEKSPEQESSKKRELDDDDKDKVCVIIIYYLFKIVLTDFITYLQPNKKERVKVPRIKTLKLTEITKPLEKNSKEKLLLGAVERMLLADKAGTGQLRQKIVVTLASSFNESVRTTVLSFLLSDLRTHLDTALAWLFEEYSIMQVIVIKLNISLYFIY